MKHSAARSVVEANVGSMFKGMKSSVKQGDQPNASTSQIYCYLEQSFTDLFQASNDPSITRIVNLPSHKNALILILAKFPSATGKAFTMSNMRKRFVLNLQIDTESKLALDMMNMLHTY